MNGPVPESSAIVATRVAAARARQRLRPGALPNGRLRGRVLRTACRLGAEEAARTVVLAEREGLSGRGTERLLRVARTIADLDASDRVLTAHLDEAARFRAPAEMPSLAEAG